nr:DUF2127 domain-containing protein [Arthrobacter stackebrandtii]
MRCHGPFRRAASGPCSSSFRRRCAHVNQGRGTWGPGPTPPLRCYAHTKRRGDTVKITQKFDWWARLFYVGIIVKGLDGVLELIAGTLLLFTAPDRIRQLAILVTQPELTEDPNDFIATHILRGADSLTDHVVLFTAFYLLAHGIVKVVLVAALLRNKLWAYPWMIVVLAIFILYQFYQLAVTPSAGLVALTLFDILIVVLTWHEYRRHRTRLGQKDGTA